MTAAAITPARIRPATLLILVSLAHAITHVYAALFPLIYPIIQREWGVSYVLLGGMVGLASFIGGLLQLAFGLFGRVLPRNRLLGLGNLFWGVTTGLTGLTSSFGPFAALRFAAAAANAPQHPLGNSMISDRYPRERRGAALAVNYAGGNLGTVAVPLAAVAIIGALGWQRALWIFAIPGIVVGVLLMLVLDDPDRVQADVPSGVSVRERVRDVLRNRNVLVLLGASAVAAAGQGLGPLLVYIPLYLSNGLALSRETVGVLYTLMFLGAVIGPMAAGRLSDRFGRRPVIVANLLGSAVVMALLIAVGPGTVLVLALLLFLIGVFAFTESSLVQVFLADSVPAGQRELVFGLYFAWVFTLAAPWNTLIGWMIDQGGFGPALWLVAGSYILTAVLILPARENPEAMH